MSKKRTNAVHINFVLILSIFLVIAVFAFSNYAKFSKTKKMIYPERLHFLKNLL